MKPCEIPCCKCGSTSIKRFFYRKGESNHLSPWEMAHSDTNYFDSGFGDNLTYSPGRSDRAIQDCILHQCVVCKYTWDSLPLKEND